MEMREIMISYFANILRNTQNSWPKSQMLMRIRKSHYTSGKIVHLFCKTKKHNLKFVKIWKREVGYCKE